MTLRYFLIFMIIIVVAKAYGQEDQAKKISYAFRAGYVNSTIHGSFVTYVNSFGGPQPIPVEDKKGFEISALGYFPVYKFLSINTGIGFMRKGGSIPGNYRFVYPFDATLYYLTVPVSLTGKIFEANNFSFHATAGFMGNFELSSDQPYAFDYPVDLKKFTVSYSIGGFVRYRLSGGLSLQGEFQYMNDLNPFSTFEDQGESYEMKTKASAFSIGVVSEVSQKSGEKLNRGLNLSLQAGFVVSGVTGSYVTFLQESSSSSPYPLTNKNGFEVLATASYSLTNLLSVSTGAGFVQKGGTIEDTGSVYPVDVTLNYLEVPVNLILNPVATESFSLSLMAGVVNNFELSSEQEFLKGTLAGDNETSNTFILSYSFGGIVNCKLNEKFGLRAEAKLVHDITPFYERDLNDLHYEMKTKSQVFSLGVNYKLNNL